MPDPASFAAGIHVYSESDLLCYRADAPAALVARQAAAWDPLLDWAAQRYDVHFTIVSGIMHAPQPEVTLARSEEHTSELKSLMRISYAVFCLKKNKKEKYKAKV